MRLWFASTTPGTASTNVIAIAIAAPVRSQTHMRFRGPIGSMATIAAPIQAIAIVSAIIVSSERR